MRSTNCLIAMCLIVFAAPLAKADPVFISFSPEAGATWEITETRTRATQQGGIDIAPKTGTVSALLKVIAETANGYDMEWTTTSVEAGGVAADGIRPDLLVGVPIRFQADTEGLPAALADSAAVLNAVEGVIRSQSASPASNAALASARAMFNNTPPKTLARVLLPEASAFGSCHNFRLEPGKVISMSDPVTAVGGQRVEATSTFVMESAGSATEPARIVITQQIGQGDLSNVINQFAEGAANPLPQQDRASLATLSRKTVTDCKVDRTSGETVTVVIDMVVSASGMQLHDRREIAVKPRN